MQQQQSLNMSTEQIYKEPAERPQSLGREYSTERIQRAKLKVKRKIGQLENKVCFFEGQLNPITIENKSLKQKLVELSREVSASCEILRNLIPVENNPTKKLKIQMASLEEISAMIKQDWVDMKQLIRNLSEQLKVAETTICGLQKQLQQTTSHYQKLLFDQKSQYTSEIAQLELKNYELKKQMAEAQEKSAAERDELIRSYSQRLEESERLKKEFKSYVSEMNSKCLNYERVAQRLRDQIANNQVEFQKSKENIKQLYQELMQEKLLQQSKQFEFILKIKQDEKLKIVQEMTATADELKKKLSEKNFEINYLSGINDKLKVEVGNAKDQIWKHKLEIDRCNKQLKQLEDRLFYESETSRELRSKIENSQNKMAQLQEKWKKDREVLQAQLNKQQLKISELKMKVQQQEEICKKLSEDAESRNLEFKRKLRESCEKYEQMLELQKNKYQQMAKVFEEDQKQLKLKINECQKKINDKEQELIEVKKSSEREKIRLLESHQSKMKKMEMEFLEKHKKQALDFEQKAKSMQSQMNKKLSQLEISNNQFVRKLMTDQNLKLNQYQTKCRQLQENAQQSLKNLEKSLSQALINNKKLQEKCEQIKKALEKVTEEHKKSIDQYQKRMDQQKRESELRLKMEKEKLMNEMQQQILMFKKTMDEREADYNSQLSHIQQRLQKEINLLKQSNAIEEIEEKYHLLMAKLKQEMNEELRKANKDKQMELEKLISEHDRQLGMLSKKLEFDISKLNEQLLQEKEIHAFDKLTREEKINYLVSKIGDYRKQLEEKDMDILELQFQIEKKNKELQKIDQIVAERVKGIKKQFELTLQEARQQFESQTNKIKSECQSILKKIETERIQFTQSIYDEFQAIKEKYCKQMQRLKSKYDELQRIFEERPSRAEDLSKIKELIEQKSKMDMEIKQCKKKVKQANEIVRYLSLELENYKQTYDIFGPGGEPLSPERRIVTESDSPLRSIIRRQSMSINSEQNQKKGSLVRQKQRRYNTESPEIGDIRLFPPLGRNTSEAVAEEDNQSEVSYQHQKPKRREAEKIMFSNNLKSNADDKSEELRSNASIFLGLMNRQSRPPVEYKSGNSGYVRRLSRRRTITISAEKKIQIKDRTFMFDQ